MKKISVVSSVSLLFLVLSSVVAFLTRDLGWESYVYAIVGVVLLAISGVIAFFAKRDIRFNVVASSVSAVGMGFLIRAWYVLRSLENNFGTMILVSLAAVAYIWLFFVITRIPYIRRHKRAYVAFVLSYLIISAVVYTVVVFTTKTTFVSTFGYYMLIEMAFIFAMSLEVDSTEELVRNITLSTYSIFAVALIVIVFVCIGALGGGDCDCDGDGICECCECLDGCGNLGGDSSSGKTKRSGKNKGGFGAP